MAGNNIKGITVEIGGDATQLNKALSDVNSKSKDLNSELNQINKLLKLDPTNVTLIAQKQDLLSKSVDNSSQKLNTLKSVQEQVNQQFQNGDIGEEQYRAFARQIESTEISLKKFAEQQKEIESTSSSVGTEMKSLGNDFDKAGAKALGFGDILKANLLSDALVGGIKAIGSAISSAVNEFKQLASSALENADNLEKLSDQTGLSVEKLQQMQYIGDDLGVSLDTQTGALSKLIKSMAGAKDGTGATAEAFKALGVSVVDSNGHLRDSNTVYGEALEALGNVTNETEATALAQQIFGKSAMELNPLIKAGSQGLADLAQQASDTSAIMSNDTVSALDSFGDSVDHLKQTVTTAAGSLLGQFAPALNDVSTSLAGLLSGKVTPDEFINNISNLIRQVTATIAQKLPDLIKTGGEILLSIIKGIIDALPQIIPIASQIILQFAKEIIQLLPEIINAGIQVLVSLINGVSGQYKCTDFRHKVHRFLRNGFSMLQAIAVTGHIDDFTVMYEPVEDSRGNRRVAEKFSPFVKALV